MKKLGSRMIPGTPALAGCVALWLAPAVSAGLTPMSALYAFGGTASAEGTFDGDVHSGSFSGGQGQPSQAPIGPFTDSGALTRSWQDPSFPSLQATGAAYSGLNASAPGAAGWSVSGGARAEVSGDFFNGALGKGHAWSEATLIFSLDAPTTYHLTGSVTGRDASLVNPTWVNFIESASVELWQGATLIHRAAGATPGIASAFDFTGSLPAGEYRVEARARARTESLEFGQPWTPAAGYEALFVIPAAPVWGFAICAAPITLRRRR